MAAFNYDGIAPTVLYDMFYEMGTNLRGFILAMERFATDEADQAYWEHRRINIHNERQAVDPHDRVSLIEVMERWKIERDSIRLMLESRSRTAKRPLVKA
jgi:hypothetical protein